MGGDTANEMLINMFKKYKTFSNVKVREVIYCKLPLFKNYLLSYTDSLLRLFHLSFKLEVKASERGFYLHTSIKGLNEKY